MNITEEASIHVRAGGDEQRVLPVSDMQSLGFTPRLALPSCTSEPIASVLAFLHVVY
jgi:hypothetical protein